MTKNNNKQAPIILPTNKRNSFLPSWGEYTRIKSDGKMQNVDLVTNDPLERLKPSTPTTHIA